MANLDAGVCQHRPSEAWPSRGKAAMTGIGRKIVYVMLVIVVLLVIWQILASF